MDETTSSQATAPESTPTTPQPSSDAGAAPSVEQAPAESAEREALRRMQGGESWDSIKSDLNARRTGQQSQQQSSTPATPAEPKADAQPQPAKTADGKEITAESLGLNDKEFNALKRGKVDPTLLQHVPASNRKALARNLMESQAAADRAYQAAKQGKTPESQPDSDNPDPDAPDVATDDGEEDGQPETQGKPRKDAEQAPTQFGTPFSLPDADYAALVDFGGEEFADGVKGPIEALGQHLQSQQQQLTGLLGYLMERTEQADFNEGIAQLSAQPGFENLDDAAKASIREQAELLVRAHQGPFGSYTLRDAVPVAAASLFRTNITQATQAQLAQRRSQSVQGSPDRGGHKPVAGAKPLSAKDRMLAIGRALQQGMTPEQARNAIDVA